MAHAFGGNWTEDKLEVMKRYFAAYAVALKGQRFARWYVDAFAGTGQRLQGRPIPENQGSLFGEDEADFSSTKDGSVRIALRIDPPFSRYVLIERSRTRIAELSRLQEEFPERVMDILEGDANALLQSFAKSTNWGITRAAVFVDPYGMQVSWDTLRALAATKAVDIALLFPTGPLTRMLTRDGKIPREWEKRIDDHLGECDWRNAAYTETSRPDLFSNQESKIEKRLTTDGLRQFVLHRLRTIFAFVSDTQLELKNSKGATLYHLFIICANPSDAAIKLAERLARGAMKQPNPRR